MKITTGVDIIEVNRIEKAICELGDSFLNKIYTDKEIQYCKNTNKMQYQHFAGKFAAKEAVFKAISEYTNNREDILWKEIEIINQEGGRPKVNIEKLKRICLFLTRISKN